MSSATTPAAALADRSRRRLFQAVLAASAGVTGWAVPPARAARPAIPLALEAPADIDPGAMLVSEKYDGVRALWDGRQLRFRSGLPVAAPAAWLAQLPAVALDGELWLGRGRFEELSGLVRRQAATAADWQPLSYMVFDLPHAPGGFAARHAQLQQVVQVVQPAQVAQQVQPGRAPALVLVAQQRLADRAALQALLASVLQAGGEGLVLRDPLAPYATGRSAAMSKLKPLHDAEAVVLAHQPGQGRHAGRLGALQVRSDSGRVFEIGTGFSDAQRAAPPAIGQRISYSHRGHTAQGVPRFASFLRERPQGL